MAKIRFPTRIAHATDDDESARYALQATLVTPEGFAVATDGHLAACVKVRADGMEGPVMVPQELGPKSKTDLKSEYHVNGAMTCERHSTVKGQRRVEQAEMKDGRFPKVGEVLDGLDADKTLVLAVNASFLWRLAQAINVPDTPAGDVVVLLIPRPDDSGVVTDAVGVLSNYDSCHGEDAGGFGVIMPCEANAAEARTDFSKLREASKASLDAAAKSWSDMCVTRWKKQEDSEAAAKETVTKPDEAAASVEPRAKSKARRKAARKQSVA
jgi:hypothetical protein